MFPGAAAAPLRDSGQLCCVSCPTSAQYFLKFLNLDIDNFGELQTDRTLIFLVLESAACPDPDREGDERRGVRGQEARGGGAAGGAGGGHQPGRRREREHLRAAAPPPAALPREDHGGWQTWDRSRANMPSIKTLLVVW